MLTSNIGMKWDIYHHLLNLDYSQTPDGLFLPAHPVSLDSAVGHGRFRLPEIVR